MVCFHDSYGFGFMPAKLSIFSELCKEFARIFLLYEGKVRAHSKDAYTPCRSVQLLQAIKGLHSSKEASLFKQGTAFIQARENESRHPVEDSGFLLGYR